MISVFAACLLVGCNGEDPVYNSQAAGNPAPTAPNPEATGTGGSESPLREGPDGRKLLVDIPLDVWFDDPLGVVQEQGTIAANTTPAPEIDAGTKEPGTVADPAPEPKPMPAAEGVAWSEVIPMAILDAEIKEDRNFLTTALQTVGKYNQSVKEIPPRAMTIAALAQIAISHSEQALWKDKAAAMRDVAVNLASAAEGTGRAPFNAATEQFEIIQEIFNGSTPELGEEPDPNLPFADKADRAPLMRRINSAFEWLNANTPTASAVEKEKEKTMHETVILKTLLKYTADKSYYLADEPDYIKHVEESMAALQQMQKGLDSGDFDSFKQGLSIINIKCQECHRGYRDN
jgi:hypothetical protein